MTTSSELREAYRQLAAAAPTQHDLVPPGLPSRGHRRRPALGLVAAAVLVLALIAGPLALIAHLRGSNAEVGGQPNATVPFPTSYVLGTSSVPGYRLTIGSLSPSWGQQFVYRATGAGSHVAAGLTVTTRVGSAAQIAQWTKQGKPVTVAGHRGFFGEFDGYDSTEALIWQVSGTTWFELQAATKTAKKDDRGAAHLHKLLELAAIVHPAPDAKVSLVKVEYLPKRAVFGGASAYTEQQAPFSGPDGTVGSGYRVLSFDDNSQDHEPASLDIFTVFDPTLPLTLANLPSLNSRSWKQITVQGHKAFASKSGIIVQWGAVQIHVSTSAVSGSNSTLFTESEMLKVADSLTVPADLSIGHGYRLLDAVPDRHLH